MIQFSEFSIPTHEGKLLTEKDTLGKRVVLFSYPEAFTPGCTAEVCSIRDQFGEILKHEVLVLGISKDSVEKIKQFHDEYKLKYTLLSDEKSDFMERLDVYGEKLLYGKKVIGTKREIIFLDEKGTEVDRIKGVRTKSTAEQILKKFDKLGW